MLLNRAARGKSWQGSTLQLKIWRSSNALEPCCAVHARLNLVARFKYYYVQEGWVEKIIFQSYQKSIFFDFGSPEGPEAISKPSYEFDSNHQL